MILDVITDFLSIDCPLSLVVRQHADPARILVILVPFNLLRQVRLSIPKKLALGGLFSITVIIMVFAVIRVVVVVSSDSHHELDQTWLYLWSGVEQAVCESGFLRP